MNKNIQSRSIDHRDIGKEQELFSFHEEGPGMPFYHARGVAIKNELIKLWRYEHIKNGYKEIETPILLDRSLWEKSGHWNLFKDNMFIAQVEGRDYVVKPMSCPGAILYYGEKKKSFKELPLKICELGHVHRNENSGSLHGTLRARSFIQDDAHIFCSKEQLVDEIIGVLNLCKKILNKCGFKEFKFELSVRSESKRDKYLGSDEDWEHSEKSLESALEKLGYSYEKKEGEAKFYGPSIDLHIKDLMGKQWQCSTIQLDFNLPKRFNVYYIDENNEKKVPLILHRAIFGSLERFIGVLLEHYKGDLPLWLSPVQVKIISVKKEFEDDSKSIWENLIDRGIRAELDLRDENLSIKVRSSQRERIPVALLIGKSEIEKNKASIRLLNGEQKNLIDWEDFYNLFN